jgi:hypothetical protein
MNRTVRIPIDFWASAIWGVLIVKSRISMRLDLSSPFGPPYSDVSSVSFRFAASSSATEHRAKTKDPVD